MSEQAIETANAPSPVVLETATTQEEPLAVVDEVEESITVGPALKTVLYGTEKERKLANHVAKAEATRKTAGEEGFKLTQNMKIEGLVDGLLTEGQSVSSS